MKIAFWANSKWETSIQENLKVITGNVSSIGAPT